MIQEKASLEEDIKSSENIINSLQKTAKSLKDSLLLLVEVKKFKDNKKEFEAQLKTKTDSIILLKNQLSEKDKQIAETRQQGYEKAKQETKRGKQEALANIVNSYKNPNFDDLIKSSTRESVQRDLQLAGDNPEIKQTLSDLDKYFSAKELLTKRYDEYGISNAQKQLKTVNQRSESLDRLKENMENYGNFSKGLKETMNKIAELDGQESVSGMGEEIKKQKLNKILTEISPYIFNYDFNLSDYPYLSDILLEIIKRKLPDADADITDLLQKL
jgi:hypothetical protein